MVTTQDLDGVVIGSTRLSRVRGEAGRLTYAGYEIEDLAAHSTYEEVCGLLWDGRLPDAAELETLRGRLRTALQVDDRVLELVRLLAPSAPPMAVLRSAISAAGCLDSEAEDSSRTAERRKAIRLAAQAGSLTAAAARLASGQAAIPPRPDLGLAANFLYMLHGRQPEAVHVRALDVCLILHADHGINPSTLAARVAAGTAADMHSAVVAGIAALKGPLHGGASEIVMKMVEAIGSPEDAASWVEAALERGERIPGFGHRTYRTVDPRVPILEALALELQERAGDTRHIEITRRVRDVMTVEMARRGRPVFPNVDLFSPGVYTALDIPAGFFPCVFAWARVPGWTAHIMEQRREHLRIRPRLEYEGPDNLRCDRTTRAVGEGPVA